MLIKIIKIIPPNAIDVIPTQIPKASTLELICVAIKAAPPIITRPVPIQSIMTNKNAPIQQSAATAIKPINGNNINVSIIFANNISHLNSALHSFCS